MAVLTDTEIITMVKDECQINVSTDAPLSDAKILTLINDEYATVWGLSGGRIKRANHTQAWTQSTTDTRGILHSSVTDIEEVTAVYSIGSDIFGAAGDKPLGKTDINYINFLRGDTANGSYGDHKLYAMVRMVAGVTLGNTAATWLAADNKVTADAANDFADIYPGMLVSKSGLTGIADNTEVIGKDSNTIVELSAITLDDGGSETISFDGESSNRYEIHLYPATASKYIAIEYVPQFVPLTTGVTPSVSDLESRDIGLLTAMKVAPLVGRAELVPSIAMRVSERTRQLLDLRKSALASGKQDK